MLTESQVHLTFWKVKMKVKAAELKVRSCPRQMFCLKDNYVFLSQLSPPTLPRLLTLIPLKPPAARSLWFSLQGDPYWLNESRELSLTVYWPDSRHGGRPG